MWRRSRRRDGDRSDADIYSARLRRFRVSWPTAHRADNMFRRSTMRNTALKVLLAAGVLIPLAVYAQPRPGNPTTATVITKAEIDKISATEQNQTTRDENARVVDIGDGWSMELGIVHRAKQRVQTVAEAQAATGRGNAPAARGGNAQ